MDAVTEPAGAGAGLVERDGVLAAVARLLDAACAERGGALFIVGPAGLGKTTLLDHAITLARPRFVVGVGGGDRVETVLPFGLIGQVLEDLRRRQGPRGQVANGAASAQTSEPDSIAAAARFYATVREVREAAVHPLLLALDDVQWSDPDSLTAIHLLCRRLEPLPVAVIATLRPWPAAALTTARELAAQCLAEVEYLAALSPGAAAALVRAQVGEPIAAEAIERAVTRCGGNPLLLEHAAVELRRGAHPPQGRLLLSRFLAAGTTAQRYVRAASVLGTRFRTTVAADMAGLSTPQAAAEFEGLFLAGLLQDASQGWAEFTHALIRHAVYDDLAPPARADLHTAAFTVLLDHQLNPAEAAEHALTAHLVGDPQAVAQLPPGEPPRWHAAAGRGATSGPARALSVAPVQPRQPGDLRWSPPNPESIRNVTGSRWLSTASGHSHPRRPLPAELTRNPPTMTARSLFYLPEAAHSWKVFINAGYAVDLISVRGGRPPMDGVDRSDSVQQAFLDDPEMSVKLTNTLRPDQIDPADYDAVVYAGGHGAMWDFPGSTRLPRCRSSCRPNLSNTAPSTPAPRTSAPG